MRQNTLVTCILTLAVLLSALAFYFSCCCNLPQNGQSWLFPGHDQYQWFLEMLSCLIWDHEAEVSELGVNPKMIGTHSIRKGAVTYMSSLPGGPSISSVCIHAGWKHWWIGDSVQGIPLLRMLDSKDLEFLDAIPLSEEEQHGRTGPNKN